MTPKTNVLSMLVIAVVAALNIIGAAVWGKDTAYENAWLYLTGIWIVFISAFDHLTKKK